MVCNLNNQKCKIKKETSLVVDTNIFLKTFLGGGEIKVDGT